jgi:hypothetical protein
LITLANNWTSLWLVQMPYNPSIPLDLREKPRRPVNSGVMCRRFMAISEFETKRDEKIVGQFVEKHRPPAHLRNQVDLAFRIEGQSVIIFEIRELWNQRDKKIESPIAKATYIKKTNSWKFYWQRADLKWHRYEPTSEVKTIEEFLAVVENDEYGCFWG